MRQSEWTRKALDVLEQAGLIATGFVNIRTTPLGSYALEVADADGVVFALTIKVEGAPERS